MFVVLNFCFIFALKFKGGGYIKQAPENEFLTGQ